MNRMAEILVMEYVTDDDIPVSEDLEPVQDLRFLTGLDVFLFGVVQHEVLR